MTKEELVDLLNHDLKNELQHMHFYLHAASRVQSLFREEIREILLEEAKSELDHCDQFSQMIVYLGGTPTTCGNDLPDTDYTEPHAVLCQAVELEKEVADNYSERLRQTESHANSNVSRIHVFYEDQIQDSWDAMREYEQMLGKIIQYT